MSMAECIHKVPDLMVMRHSKSAYPLGIADHDRPLNERGCRDAQAARQWFAQMSPDVDEVWVSSAERAQQTWALVEPGLHSSTSTLTSVTTLPDLYEASLDELMSLLSTCTAKTLLVIAHNPGLEQLISTLVGMDPLGWLPSIRMKYPTGAICTMRLGAWTDLAPGQAELISYVVPRAS